MGPPGCANFGAENISALFQSQRALKQTKKHKTHIRIEANSPPHLSPQSKNGADQFSRVTENCLKRFSCRGTGSEKMGRQEQIRSTHTQNEKTATIREKKSLPSSTRDGSNTAPVLEAGALIKVAFLGKPAAVGNHAKVQVEAAIGNYNRRGRSFSPIRVIRRCNVL